MKPLNILLALSLVCGSLNASAQSKTQKKQNQAKTGGSDTGGGDAQPYELEGVTTEELKVGVTRASKYLRTFIHAQEIQYRVSLIDPNTPGSYRAIPGRYYTKFFMNPKRTVYDVLDQITINIQDAPCREIDEKGIRREVDAFMSEKEMCLSLKRLAKKITKENLYSESIGLMMHELTHAFGEKHPKNTKPEHDPLLIFQRTVGWAVPKYPVKVFMTHPELYENQASDLLYDLDSLISLTTTEDTNQTRLELELFKQKLQEFARAALFEVTQESLGVSCLNRQQLIDLQNARAEVEMAAATYGRDRTLWRDTFLEEQRNVNTGDHFTPSLKNPYMTYQIGFAPELPFPSMILVGYRDQASLGASLIKVRERLVKTRAQFQKWKPENLGLKFD